MCAVCVYDELCVAGSMMCVHVCMYVCASVYMYVMCLCALFNVLYILCVTMVSFI